MSTAAFRACLVCLGSGPLRPAAPGGTLSKPVSRGFMVSHYEYPSERCAGCLGVIDSQDATENLVFCWNCLNYIWEVV